MRVLVFTKRQYMAKDLLDDRFGRFREIPLELAKLGHEVVGVCLSYRRRDEGVFRDGNEGACVSWRSFNLGRLVAPGLRRYLVEVQQLATEFKPDVIWACSDAFHAIFGSRIARTLNIPCAVDLYDNFESFGASRIPGVKSRFKVAVKSAEGVTCISEPLRDKIIQEYGRGKPTIVLENGVREDLFYPQERTACRVALGLPVDARIIGTAGALDPDRGTGTLFKAYDLLTIGDDTVHLAVAGPRKRGTRLPSGPKVHDFGMLPLERVPSLVNALDVAVLCNRDSAFGRYNFPQKFYEIIACRVPLAAAAVGSMRDMLAGHPECLFEPENPESLGDAIRSQLANPTVLDFKIPTWADLARRLEGFLREITGGGRVSKL